jgi:hypothetical protein
MISNTTKEGLGQDDVVSRFYSEDYSIGKLMPSFNIDIER